MVAPALTSRDVSTPLGGLSQMSDAEFLRYQVLIERLIGIHLIPIKKAMLSGRLAKRLRERKLSSFGEYFLLIDDGGDLVERQIAIDLITTNETYFFREPKHFEALRNQLLPTRKEVPFRAWSAACASGDESYSIAMVLADVLGERAPWEILATDISSRMLASAQRGLYPLERGKLIPPDLLRRFCLRGTGEYAGTFLVDKNLRKRVSFGTLNLVQALPDIGYFDVIFLRNVIIYFDAAMKRRVIDSLIDRIKPGGWLVVGHSETLIGLPPSLESILPAIYLKK